jgi:hypothetical protein
MNGKNGRYTKMAAVGLVGGFVAGFVVWSREQVSHRRDLFSSRPLRRLAALGYLAGRPSAETARLLQDYIRWETRPDLRRRATRLLGRVERQLV